MEIMTNSTYANTIKVFKTACEIANVDPTPRQASKFQNNKGAAFACKNEAKTKAYRK